MTTILSAQKMLRTTQICAAADRAQLTGALVEPIPEGGAWIVATTGTVMLVQRDRTAIADRPMVLRMTLTGDDERLLTDDDYCPSWTWAGAQLHIPDTVSAGPQAAGVIWPDGPPRTHVIIEEICPAEIFPAEWRRVIGLRGVKRRSEKIPDWTLTGIRPALLDLLTSWSNACRLHVGTPGTSVIVSYDEEPDVLGVIAVRAMYPENAANLRALLNDLGHAETAAALDLDAEIAQAEGR